MATFTWTLQGSTPTTIGASDKLQFADGTFNGPIVVSAYNDSMHVDQNGAGSVDLAASNTPNNNKFISQAGGGGGDSQADWGGGTEDLDQILVAEASLEVNFSHGSSVSTSSAVFYADDGGTPTNGPTDVTFVAAEVGDTNFHPAEGSGSSLSLTNQGTATSHDFYIVLSASPDSVGAKTAFRLNFSLTYS